MSRRVIVVGSGIAGTAAALAAARAGAEVIIVMGGPGASSLSSGALDDLPWEEEMRGRASPLEDGAQGVLDALGGLAVGRDPVLLASLAGALRPARGRDRALLDLGGVHGAVLVPVLDQGAWDGEALARSWNAEAQRRSDTLKFVPRPASLLQRADEHQLPDAELAQRHDDPSRLAWLAARVREACAGTGAAAVMLPPWLGVEREAATALGAQVGIPCGEVVSGVGGPSGLRFERARDRALEASTTRKVSGRATRVSHRVDPDAAWCVELDGGESLTGDCVVIATGGVLGGGLAYTPGAASFGTALPSSALPLMRMTCEAPGSLGADGRPLEDPASLFGAAPESHAWPHVESSLLDRAGVLCDSEGRVNGAAPGLYAVGELRADSPHTWLVALASGANAGLQAATR